MGEELDGVLDGGGGGGGGEDERVEVDGYVGLGVVLMGGHVGVCVGVCDGLVFVGRRVGELL